MNFHVEVTLLTSISEDLNGIIQVGFNCPLLQEHITGKSNIQIFFIRNTIIQPNLPQTLHI
jgi:hypothetical protein